MFGRHSFFSCYAFPVHRGERQRTCVALDFSRTHPPPLNHPGARSFDVPMLLLSEFAPLAHWQPFEVWADEVNTFGGNSHSCGGWSGLRPSAFYQSSSTKKVRSDSAKKQKLNLSASSVCRNQVVSPSDLYHSWLQQVESESVFGVLQLGTNCVAGNFLKLPDFGLSRLVISRTNRFRFWCKKLN